MTAAATASHQTLPPVPDVARPAVGRALPVLEAYARLLAGPGVERGLLGPREAPRLWERHLLNCSGLAELVPPEAEVADVGSGAGLPGLVLATLRPDCAVVLVEPMLRRATFLQEAVDHLGLERVQVRRARAEELAGQLQVDAVVARAVAPLHRLLTWSWPLLRPGGQLLALKGAGAPEEIEAAGPTLRRLGARASLVEVGDAATLTAATVVVARGADTVRSRR